MNIRPLADRVLIKPAAAEEKTLGGIIIPDSAKEKPLKGEIVAVGNGTKDEEMVVKVGDNVLYGKYAGTEIIFNKKITRIKREFTTKKKNLATDRNTGSEVLFIIFIPAIELSY